MCSYIFNVQAHILLGKNISLELDLEREEKTDRGSQTEKRFSFPGKNMKRSIHGVGQMMSTMVLSRKQSVYVGAGRSGLSVEAQSRGKDSIDNQDVTVMDTKLKILEILQVSCSDETCRTHNCLDSKKLSCRISMHLSL